MIQTTHSQPQQPQQQQQPAPVQQQQPQVISQQHIDEALSQVLNPLQLSIFKCQLHAYKLIGRNQPLPDNMLTALKSKVSRPRKYIFFICS